MFLQIRRGSLRHRQSGVCAQAFSHHYHYRVATNSPSITAPQTVSRCCASHRYPSRAHYTIILRRRVFNSGRCFANTQSASVRGPWRVPATVQHSAIATPKASLPLLPDFTDRMERTQDVQPDRSQRVASQILCRPRRNVYLALPNLLVK